MERETVPLRWPLNQLMMAHALQQGCLFPISFPFSHITLFTFTKSHSLQAIVCLFWLGGFCHGNFLHTHCLLEQIAQTAHLKCTGVFFPFHKWGNHSALLARPTTVLNWYIFTRGCQSHTDHFCNTPADSKSPSPAWWLADCLHLLNMLPLSACSSP